MRGRAGREFTGPSSTFLTVAPLLPRLSFTRNYGLGATELGPPEYHKQDALEIPMELTIKLGKEMELFDVRSRQFLGRRSQYTFKLDRIQPTLLTILPARPAVPRIETPAEARRGTLLKVSLFVGGVTPETTHVLRVRLLRPDHEELAELTRNLKAPGGKADWELPLAASLREGRYTLEVLDVPTGTRFTQSISLR